MVPTLAATPAQEASVPMKKNGPRRPEIEKGRDFSRPMMARSELLLGSNPVERSRIGPGDNREVEGADSLGVGLDGGPGGR